MKKSLVKLIDPQGFHARPVGIAVNKISEYDCEGYVFHDGREERMDSVVKILKMGIPTGSTFMIATEGKDENTAIYDLIEKLEEIGLIELVEKDVEN